MHNPETNEFEPLPGATAAEKERRAGHRVFMVGQTISLNGLVFRIRKITRKDLVLRPVPQRGET